MFTKTIEDMKLTPNQLASARMLDHIVEAIYGPGGIPDATIHGGLAIWRCYGSGRFSGDIDAYVSNPISRDSLDDMLMYKNLSLQNYRDTGNVIFAKVGEAFGDGKMVVSVELMRKNVNGVVTNYTKTDGTTIEVVALNPAELISEKINAYENRWEMRDLYDIRHLGLNVIGVKSVPTEMKMDLGKFLRTIQRPRDKGKNENDLNNRVHEDKIPNYDQLVADIGRIARH